MQRPISYWAAAPTINAMCGVFGDYWENMTDGDRYTIARGVIDAIRLAALGSQRERLDYLCTQDGYQFQRHRLMVGYLARLQTELSEQEARSLAAGILTNGSSQ